MKTATKFLSVLVAVVMLLSVVSASATEAVYERADEGEIYELVLGDFEALMSEAEAAGSISERFVLEAKAEAYLLDSAVVLPTTSRGGNYAISRIAPRTVPYVQWGNDDDRLHGMVISDEFITPDERAELLDQWAAAVAGEGEYDPAAYLTAKGHTLQTEYKTTFETAPVTIDWLNTSHQSDTEITVNTVDGLVEYNNLGQMKPAMAESWDISDDGLTYTFHIRQGAKWYTSEGVEYADVTARDFVAGFQHMIDAAAGLESLVAGAPNADGEAEGEVVAGTFEYLYNGGSWDDVGYVAADDYTLVVTLAQPVPYFMTMLTYSIFLPVCAEFYESRGGVYGIEEYANRDTENYKFGLATDVASQVYNGPYLLQKLESGSELKVVKNPSYYKADEVTLDSIAWIYDDGSNIPQFYADVVAGTYAGCNVENKEIRPLAEKDGNFEKYAYVSDTDSTTYFSALNLDRGTFALANGGCASNKTEQQKIDTQAALLNRNFRKAVQHAFDRTKWNAIGRSLNPTSNMRNIYTYPGLVQLDEDVTYGDKTFTAGTMYGELVQYFLDELGENINVEDSQDGWYDADAAKAYLEAAKEELGDTVTWPIQLDVVYYPASESQAAQGNVCKQVIEETLGAENVIVNLVEATTTDDYYACGYRSYSGFDSNYDIFYGSGWGPDWGDPNTYLNTFLGYGAGYMTKTIGLF